MQKSGLGRKIGIFAAGCVVTAALMIGVVIWFVKPEAGKPSSPIITEQAVLG